MRLFLLGWGFTAEAWAPFAAPDDRLSDGFGAEIDAGAHVVAWSLGAMEALEAATTIELGSLTLIAASGRFTRRDGYPFGWRGRTLARMRERLSEEADAVLDEFWALALAPDENVAQPPRERDLDTLARGLSFLERYSMLERAGDIRCPVRLLHGGQDRICPLGAAETLAAAIPGAELAVWPEAGHAPFLSQPGRFRSWLTA